jgi:hypothetical protein
MVKIQFDGKLGGIRRTGRGRPRLKWPDDVEADCRRVDVKRWRLIARDRTEWGSIVRKATALQGP